MIFSPFISLWVQLLIQDHALHKSIQSREIKDPQCRYILGNGICYSISAGLWNEHYRYILLSALILYCTSNIEFLCGSFTFPARQQWEIALWIMCLFDLLLGSLNNFGPKEDKEVKIICFMFMSIKIFIQSEKQKVLHNNLEILNRTKYTLTSQK